MVAPRALAWFEAAEGGTLVEPDRTFWRYYFAGQALGGYIASYAHPQSTGQPTSEGAAAAAEAYAEALLAKLESEEAGDV